MHTIRRRTPADLSDYFAIFMRRKWWIVLPAAAVLVAVYVVGLKLPRSYKSETLILVDPQKVPSDYVKPTVSGEVSERLRTISQEILSRTRLQRIISKFNLYANLRSTSTEEDIIEAMRKDIEVEVITDNQPREKGVGAFRISYMSSSPTLAQQVTREIASLFIEENLKQREEQALGTTQFIDSELEKSRQALQTQEDRIRSFKARYMGSLPEQQQANLSLLGQYQALLQQNGDALARAQQQKMYLESIMQTVSKPNAVKSKSPLQQELDQKRAELISAEQKYKPNHPDVVRLRGEVTALEQKGKELAEKEPLDPAGSGNSTSELEGQIRAVNQEIKTRTDRQADIEGKVRAMQGRVELLPAVEQQFAEISRDYETSKTNYESLLAKRNSSALAAEMERHAKGEQFRILDPASLPEKPFRPNMMQIYLLGAMAALVVGGGTGMALEFRDKSVHDEKDIAFYLNLPVLSSVPVITGPAAPKPTGGKNSAVKVAALALVPVLLAGASLVVRTLREN